MKRDTSVTIVIKQNAVQYTDNEIINKVTLTIISQFTTTLLILLINYRLIRADDYTHVTGDHGT